MPDNLFQSQVERITAIIENDISGLSVAQIPVQQIDTRLPMVLIMLSRAPNARRGSSNYKITTTWDLHLYLNPTGQGVDYANQVDLYAYIEKFYDSFLSRKRLQLNGDALDYVTDTDIQLVNGVSNAKSYPPRIGQSKYWGCLFQLTVTSSEITVQSN